MESERESNDNAAESARTIDGQADKPAARQDEPGPTAGVSSTGERKGRDHTIEMKAGSGDSTQHMNGGAATYKPDDKTGVWGSATVVPHGAMAPGSDNTLAAGAQPGAAGLEASAAKARVSKKKRKQGPLGGKKSVAGYQILGELGRGGMGVVYKARQPGANRIVALKMVLNSGHIDKETLARFKIEAEAVALLQHPNIVQLYEVGEEDGCPFFSLEFVEGESLCKKIENMPQPPRDAALLVQRIAEGMDTAHRRGIIHRDLKPANILLTRDGVPKITDFGLAKRFEDQGAGQTRTGAIMGTPSYMAPEQAQGRAKETGPATDIYSLGAILYDMLTGRPPFRGSTLVETLQQVQTLEPVAPKNLQPSVPRDLQTICLKALEKDPKKRYLTAGALAEDLRRFQAGEPILARPASWAERGWKWARRRPALASLIAVSVVGLLSLLILGGFWLDSDRRAAEAVADVERKRAAEQTAARKKEEVLRQAAERNFKRAKLAVDQMLSEVGQDRLRYIPLMEPVRRDLLQKAKGFYDEFARERSSDPDIRREAALAQQRVADILEMLGDSRTALGAYGNALELFQALGQEYPDKLEYKKDLATVANNFGNLLKDLKRNQDAEKNYRRALELRQTLHDDNPKAPAPALELAKSHNNLAQVLYNLGQTTEAETEFQASRQILTMLAASPGATEHKAELARTLNNLGTLQKTMGPADAAEKSFAEAARWLLPLTVKHANNPVYRQELAHNYFLQGRLLRDAAPKQAAEHYRQAIKLGVALAKDFSSTPIYRQELSNSYSDLAILLQAAGKQKQADEAYDQALAMQRQIVADFPHLPDYRRALASSLNNRGIMLLGSSRPTEGEAALVEALKLFSKLTAENKDVPDYATELANTYLNLGGVWQATQPKKALDSVKRALELRARLANENPQVPDYQEKLARAENNLGLLLLGEQPWEAKTLFSRALDTFAALFRDNPKNPDYCEQRAISHYNLGNALRDLTFAKEAETEWRQAITLYQDLARDFPDVPRYAQELGKRYNDLGIFLAGAKRFTDAEKAWQDGMAVQAKLLTLYPDRPEYRTELGRNECNLGILFAQAGEFDKAEKQYRQGIALLEDYEPKLAVTPAYPGFIGELIKLHVNLANLMSARNRPAEEEKSLLRLIELREKLVEAFPQTPHFRLEAVALLNEVANRVMQNQQFGEAKAFYTKAVNHLRVLTGEPDVSADMWVNVYLMQLNLATSLVGLKDHADAARVVGALPAQAPPKQRQDHVAAALLARCAGLAGEDKELAKIYADQAIALLRQAVGQGFQDGDFLGKNEDFQALRGRDDFQRLVQELQRAPR